jgi:cyclopropane-fatty-acyl-phospholipid synthase
MRELIQKFVTEHGIKVHNKKIYSKLLLNPSLGAGEGYMQGWWDCDKLDQLFTEVTALQNETFYKKTLLSRVLSLVLNCQSKIRSKKVAQLHYNLGNDLYRAMLGPSMAYTCGYWKKGKNLDEAQRDKYDLVCRKLNLKKGDKVLELGCGFGGFAKHAAENYGCEVTAVNISTEQITFAKELCKGLPVQFHLADYRDDKTYNPTRKQFDQVVSIGMCEHVGPKNYRTFLETAFRNLKDSGLFLLHTIGNTTSEASIDPWLGRYIFPGAVIPSTQQLSRAAENLFVIEDWHNFGADYDKTLMAWDANFEKAWPTLQSTYGDKFYRMWKYYLLCCAGCFRSRTMQLWQVVLSKGGVRGGYQSIRE